MFDWDRFKNGEIAVHCDNEEKANDFLKECEKRNIKWGCGDNATHHNNYSVYYELTCYYCGKDALTYCYTGHFILKSITIVKWEVEEMKELTFKEVIANIKEGEVWESNTRTIERQERGINIKRKNKEKTYYMYFDDNEKFKLQIIRKEYTFEEAFKALKIGKEIESLVSGEKYEIIESEFRLPTGDPGKYIKLSYKEIEGKWYIND